MDMVCRPDLPRPGPVLAAIKDTSCSLRSGLDRRIPIQGVTVGSDLTFLDQAGGLWVRGALNGKVGGAFTSTATQHGGQEATLFSIITNLLHFGMTIVGLPYSHQGQMTLDEIVGGSPYGATTVAGGQGQRQPSAIELAGARHQGELIAKTANKLFG